MNISSWFNNLAAQKVPFKMRDHILSSIFGYKSSMPHYSLKTFFINGGVYLENLYNSQSAFNMNECLSMLHAEKCLTATMRLSVLHVEKCLVVVRRLLVLHVEKRSTIARCLSTQYVNRYLATTTCFTMLHVEKHLGVARHFLV